jgi:hypothetical protein
MWDGMQMRKQSYIEGKEAQKKFEETMKDLFKGGWSTDRPARRFSGAHAFVFGFCLPAAGRKGWVLSAVRFFTSELVLWSCPPPPPRPSSPISRCSEHTAIRSDPRKGIELMSNIRNLMQRGVSISRPAKIIIVWANQSCRTGCDFDPQFVKECK